PTPSPRSDGSSTSGSPGRGTGSRSRSAARGGGAASSSPGNRRASSPTSRRNCSTSRARMRSCRRKSRSRCERTSSQGCARCSGPRTTARTAEMKVRARQRPDRRAGRLANANVTVYNSLPCDSVRTLTDRRFRPSVRSLRWRREHFMLIRFSWFQPSKPPRRQSVTPTTWTPQMLDKRNDRRLTLLLMLGLVAGGLLASAAPAEAQGRYRVLVPRLERQGDADKNFGRRTSDELRKLIDDLPTHAPVENRDLRDELRRFKLSEDDLSNCVTARQLAAQAGYELVMCGSYAAAPGGGFEVTAQFVNPKEVQSFDVPTFNVPDHKQAAQHIFTAFRDYIDQVTYVVYCTDALESGQWQTALENCNKVLELNDSHQTALYGRGYALMQLEQHDQALESLKKVLELNPIHQEALMAAGFVAAAMGRMEESRGYYREYLELNPG